MHNQIKNIFSKTLLFLILMFFTSDCNYEKTKNIIFETGNYTKAKLDSGNFTEVNLIKFYPKDNIHNSTLPSVNLFIGIKLSSKDTIYLLDNSDYNEDASKFITDTTSYGPIRYIDNINSKKQNLPSKVVITVPEDFQIKTAIQYLYGKPFIPLD